MRGRSEAFDAALRSGDWTMAVKLEVYRGGSLLGDLTDYLMAGSVHVEKNAACRRTGNFSLIDEAGAIIPTSADSWLTPYGFELQAYRGLVLDGVEELLPIGRLRIATSRVRHDPSGISVVVSAFDNADTIARGEFEEPYVISDGTNGATAIRALIESRLSGLTYRFSETTHTLPPIVFDEGTNPLEAARSLARMIGMELFFDPTGVCVLQPEPDPYNTDPVWTYEAADSDALLLAIDRELSDVNTFNGVVYSSDSSTTNPSVRGSAYDTDTASPTLYGGTFGKRVKKETSTMIKTAEQATAAAQADLNSRLGLTEAVRLSTVIHPAHEVDDLVMVTDEDLSIDAGFVFAAFDISMEPEGSMEPVMRERRVFA